MSVITLFCNRFCHEEPVTQALTAITGHLLITDDMVSARASELSGIKKSKLINAFSSRTSVFNSFTHEKECSMAYMRLALAKLLEDKSVIVSGYTGFLIPNTLDPLLRVCLTANTQFRQALAKNEENISEDELFQVFLLEAKDASAWTDLLFSIKDPWNPILYDIVISMDQSTPDKAAARIFENLLTQPCKPTKTAETKIKDFLLAADTEVALVNAGHNVDVQADNGNIILTINKQILMLTRLEDELKSIAGTVPGVLSVETRMGQPAAPPIPIYRKHHIELPSKVLLVDDEKEFVQTLSERLQMRNMGSVVAYDGQSALDLVQNDAPEVMIIDLKMPGIDGMEILKQVKQTRPEIEVIVLTGHGSEHDKKKCLDLGAFAYMQKPADISLLSEALKKAHEKVKTGK